MFKLTTFLTRFCKGDRQKYTVKKVCLNWRSNSQPPGHESAMLASYKHRFEWMNDKLLLCMEKSSIVMNVFKMSL